MSNCFLCACTLVVFSCLQPSSVDAALLAVRKPLHPPAMVASSSSSYLFATPARTEHEIKPCKIQVWKATREAIQLNELTACASQTKLFNMNCGSLHFSRDVSKLSYNLFVLSVASKLFLARTGFFWYPVICFLGCPWDSPYLTEPAHFVCLNYITIAIILADSQVDIFWAST